MTDRVLATTTACLTFFLLLVGGIVHGTGSSLACPDWPTCYGTFFPEMKGGVFFEHSHRLVASLVGLLTIGIVVMVHRQRREKRLRRLSWAALGLVIFQGILGGITVIYKLPAAVSSAHLATSMIFFSLL
ncbi:MAG: COX15/CtaA family protein, partial [Bdellovibrionota bacterium]